MSHRIVVVGAGIAGGRTCVQLRQAGHDGRITLVGAENRPPYDRPPLSKAALHEPTDTTLPHDLEGDGVELLLGRTAQALDTGARRLVTDHEELPYDCLVIATGSAPIRLPGPGPQLTLRTADDATRLRSALTPGRRVTIVGAGWIGAEVATAALARGCAVSCVEAASSPLGAAFGPDVAAELLGFWAGVELHLGVGVRSVEPGRVELSDGAAVASDVVVSGVGVRPCVEWLAGSPVALDRGVLVDGRLRSSVEGVYAVGDAAVQWSERRGRHRHTLHWDDAAEAPAALAAVILDPQAPVYDPVPYFWSDQFGHKLQYVGAHDADDRQVWRRAPDGALRGVAWLGAAGELTAYLAIDRPRDALQARLGIGAGATPDPANLADPAVAVRAA